MTEPPITQPSATHAATLALLSALVDEVKAAAHDPATVHLVADKLKAGIDRLADALAPPEQKAKP